MTAPFQIAAALAALVALGACASLPTEPFESRRFGQWGVSCSIDEQDRLAACRVINQRQSRGSERNYLEVKATRSLVGLHHSLQPSIRGYWYRYQGPYADVVEVLSFRWGEKIDDAFLQVDDGPTLALKDSSAAGRTGLVERLREGRSVRMWGFRANGERVDATLDLAGFAEAYDAGLGWLRP